MSNFDTQKKIASDLLKNKGIFIVHKATRTGATFCLVLMALAMGLKVVILTPTKRILTELNEKLPRLLSKPFRMTLIGPNTQLCPRLDPKLNIAFQLKEDCGRCSFKGNPDVCPFQRLLLNEFDVYGLTYDKLQALQQSQSQDSKTILNKIMQCNARIVDESTTAILYNPQALMLVHKESDIIERLSERIERLLPKRKSWVVVLRAFLEYFESKRESGLFENSAWNSILPSEKAVSDAFREG